MSCGTTTRLLFPATSQAHKTMSVQRERLKGGKTGDDSHRKFSEGWKFRRPWLDFRKVTTTDLDSEAILCLSQPCSASRTKWLASSTLAGANRQCGQALAGGDRGRSWIPSRITRARKQAMMRIRPFLVKYIFLENIFTELFCLVYFCFE